MEERLARREIALVHSAEPMCCLCMSSQLCLGWLGRCGGVLVNDDLLALALRLLAVAKEDDLDCEIISVRAYRVVSKYTVAGWEHTQINSPIPSRIRRRQCQERRDHLLVLPAQCVANEMGSDVAVLHNEPVVIF